MSSKRVSSKFDRFYLDEINAVKLDSNNQDRNKLRFYKTFKGTFSREPYLDLVHNRNQRAWLTRMRVSAHHLQIEVGRWSRPPVPPWERVCRYCNDSSIDNEGHFLHDCVTFTLKRNCLFALLDTVVPGFLQLSREHKILTMLCPTNSKATKLVSKFIGILFKARCQIDDGTPVQNIVCSFQTSNLID